MFCAGLTVFAPLYRHGAGPGKKVGVMGIGGLGHYAILFAKALGAEVYVFTHSPTKADDARKMGANHVIDTHEDVRTDSVSSPSHTTLTSGWIHHRVSRSPSQARSTYSSPRSTFSARTGRSGRTSPCCACTASS